MVTASVCEKAFRHLWKECMTDEPEHPISQDVRFDMFMTLYVAELTEYAERLALARRYMQDHKDWTDDGLNDLIDECPRANGMRSTLRWHWHQIVERQDRTRELTDSMHEHDVFRMLTNHEPIRPVSAFRHGPVVSLETTKLLDWRRLYRMGFGEGKGSDTTTGYSGTIRIEDAHGPLNVPVVGLRGPDAKPQTHIHEVQHALHALMFLTPEAVRASKLPVHRLLQTELDFALEEHKDEVLARTVDSDGMHALIHIRTAGDPYNFPSKRRVLSAMDAGQRPDESRFKGLWGRTMNKWYPLRANIQRHIGEVLRTSLAGGDSTMFHVFELAPARMWIPVYRHMYRHGMPMHDMPPDMPNPRDLIEAAREEIQQ